MFSFTIERVHGLMQTRVASGLMVLMITVSSAVASPPQASNDPHASPQRLRAPSYESEVQPIFDRRCLACHGCLGSPCNVKLDSFPGVDRGGYAENPYSVHLLPMQRTDMDAADSTAAWRERGFYPVLERTESPERNLSESLLYRLIDAAQQHNGPGFERAAIDGFRLQRFAGACPATLEALTARLEAHPGLGMPFGLPALSDTEFNTLRDWIAAGSPGPDPQTTERAAQPNNPAEVVAWEAYFNDPDPRQALVSRFIFDHVFLATIVLDGSPGERFRLVRSSTAPATPETLANAGDSFKVPAIQLISTDLPYDDPTGASGIERFWYRLQKITEAPVQKSLFLWQLSLGDIDRYRGLFFEQDWDQNGDLDPPWGIGNPFQIFAAIPPEARYRFLLDNAEVIVGGITYGPVCNGQTATYAIKDQFWVYFVDPSHDASVQDPKLGAESWEVFMDGSPLANADYVSDYEAVRARLNPKGYGLDAVWNGDGANPNAWLTVLRHETNVSVLQGARGGLPRTSWLINYSGLERMYYALVASFQYWSGDPSKLETLLFFNFLRQEFEDAFLLLLPADQRLRIRDEWSQGTIGSIGLEVVPFQDTAMPTATPMAGPDPLLDLARRLADHFGAEISGLPDPLNPYPLEPRQTPARDAVGPIKTADEWEAAMASFTVRAGLGFVPHLPSVIVLRLTDPKAPAAERHRVYSLVANRVYATQYALLFQNAEALPDQDTMSLYPTLVNGFPNLFIDLDLGDANRFIADLKQVASMQDWEQFKGRWAILRNSEHMWPFYDWINHWNTEHRGAAAGWLDLTYYDNPED